MAPAHPLFLLRSLLPVALWLTAAAGGAAPAPAQVQVQLQCAGTLLETRGSAELKRDIQRLAVSLGLEAEAADADRALAALQGRLAAVRQRLVLLRVQDLRVSSPSTWQRPQEPRTAGPRVVASLQVSGELAPERLQEFVRQVGALEGVRLNPVATEADPAAMPAVRARLLRAAYQDALAQAQELAAAVGRSGLRPLDVRVEGHELRLMAMRAATADAAPFDPAELPQPIDRLALQVRFCAS
jgi:uncharacterized protein YggE